MTLARIAAQSRMISSKAHAGDRNPKKMADHAAFNANWMRKTVIAGEAPVQPSATRQTFQAEIVIRK